MQNQASRAIFDYWINIKGDRAAPLRAEIDPTALRHLLPHLFIAASGANGLPAFRLAGTRICDLFDREFRGIEFAQAWATGDRRSSSEIFHQVIQYEKPVLLDVCAESDGKRHAYEMLLLPLRAVEMDACDRVLGSLLPRTTAFPLVHPPATGLSLENWTFLTGSPAHFGVPATGDHRSLPRALRHFLLPRIPGADGAS